MNRRAFITLLGGAAAPSLGPLAGRAQQPATPVVGYLTGASREGAAAYMAAIRQGLSEAGFVDGRNVTIEGRFADDHYERLPMLAAELVERRVAVIATDPRVTARGDVRTLTTTIPVVFLSGGDPVKIGYVTRLDRPGGNQTGVAILSNVLNAKRFGLFRDLVPQVTSIGVLSDSTNPASAAALADVEEAAGALHVPIKVIRVSTEDEIDAAFAAFARDGVGAVYASNGFFFFSRRGRLIELALRYRMPLSGELREFVTDGALMSYAPNLTDAFRQMGIYAGRILKGEKPGDLPVQLPTKFEFLINLKTAKALGLAVPPALLATADEVIE
jgi:putative tryptophan/tyrosine transport system substrate-binding protein